MIYHAEISSEISYVIKWDMVIKSFVCTWQWQIDFSRVFTDISYKVEFLLFNSYEIWSCLLHYCHIQYCLLLDQHILLYTVILLEYQQLYFPNIFVKYLGISLSPIIVDMPLMDQCFLWHNILLSIDFITFEVACDALLCFHVHITDLLVSTLRVSSVLYFSGSFVSSLFF
jgi:hypothetical protein